MHIYPVVEEDFWFVCHTLVPEKPHGVVDDERSKQIPMDVDPSTLQALPIIQRERVAFQVDVAENETLSQLSTPSEHE